MLVGIPKEIKANECRVSLSPCGARELISHGHQVVVQTNAGYEIGYSDEDYHNAGALVVDTLEEVYSKCDLIVKVKEPQTEECVYLREGQMLFSYLHLAAEPRLTELLMQSGCIAIAFETITSDRGTLPILAPMSEVAGRVAVQAGAQCLEKSHGGRGVLLSGLPGVAPGIVTIIGGGVVGLNAAIVASGLGARVNILERSIERIRELEWHFGNRVNIIYNTTEAIEEYVLKADLLIGAILIPGAAAPKIITADMVSNMRRGSVIVDVAIDQGGCVETMVPTTHENPTFEVDGIVHYGVTNMPSAVAYSASRALENTLLPYVLRLADNGYRSTMKSDAHFKNGLNIYKGSVTSEPVANTLNHAYTPASRFLGE